MLYKPLSLDPIHVLGFSIIGVERPCSGCGVKMNVEDGVVLSETFRGEEYLAFKKDPEHRYTTNLHHAYIPFCDTLCILENWCMKGSA